MRRGVAATVTTCPKSLCIHGDSRYEIQLGIAQLLMPKHAGTRQRSPTGCRTQKKWRKVGRDGEQRQQFSTLAGPHWLVVKPAAVLQGYLECLDFKNKESRVPPALAGCARPGYLHSTHGQVQDCGLQSLKSCIYCQQTWCTSSGSHPPWPAEVLHKSP